MKSLFLIFLFIIITSGFQSISINSNSDIVIISKFDQKHTFDLNEINQKQKFMNYNKLTPILINGNNKLISLAATNGWKGNGTEINPFIIENYNITGADENENALVQFFSMSLFVKLRNCYLKNGKWGVLISSAKNIIIENNVLINNQEPIFIIGESSNINITQNEIISNLENSDSYGGVSIHEAREVNIYKNNISQNVYGVQVLLSKDINIYENIVDKNRNHGIWVRGSSEIIINDNIITNHSNNAGIFISDLKDSGNINGSQKITIQNNTVYGNNYGIKSSILIGEEYGTKSSVLSELLISQNIIHDNWIGGLAQNCSNWNFLNNTVYNNERYAIQIIDINTSNVKYNTFITNRNHILKYSIDSDNDIVAVEEDLLISQISHFGIGHVNISQNFWSDHMSIDKDSDKIIDVKYIIEGTANNSDDTPLVEIPTTIKKPFLSKPTILFPTGFESIKENFLVNWTEAKIYPNGGEVKYSVYIGNEVNSYDVTLVTNWNKLNNNLLDASYDLDIASIDDEWYHIKVVAESNNGLKSEDTNDKAFSIGIDRQKDQLRGAFGGSIPGFSIFGVLGILIFVTVKKKKK